MAVAAGMATAVGVLLVAGAAFAPPAAAAAGSTTDSSDLRCVVPTLPHGDAGASSRAARLSGPAVTALTGGAARHGFALDDGDLVVQPPTSGDVPLLTANQAICGAMNATDGLSGSIQQGVAVGYGRVSVAAHLFPAITGLSSPGFVPAKNPTVQSFHDRLAWLVVVHTGPVVFGCPESSRPVRLAPPRASDHGYEVFMLDARTGTDAIVYREGGPGGCPGSSRIPPSVSAAEESVSVPWTLVARDPGGYSGTIAATVLPCDTVPSTVLVDPNSPNVEVRVSRPFGPPCGRPTTATIALHAAEVTADLPAVIGHDPVGLINLLSLQAAAPRGAAPTTTTTAPAIVSVDASMNGQTLELTVGQVVALQPLPGSQGFSVTSPGRVERPRGPRPAHTQPATARRRIPGLDGGDGRHRGTPERLRPPRVGSGAVQRFLGRHCRGALSEEPSPIGAKKRGAVTRDVRASVPPVTAPRLGS